jgi:Zn-dependent peptidase ImmA (M78 family)
MSAKMNRSAPINPAVLAWAMDDGGYTPDRLADGLGKTATAATVKTWIDGSKSPTEQQLKKLAGLLKRPVALFYLPSAPEAAGVPPNLRSAQGEDIRGLDPDELRLLRRARREQRLFRWLLTQNGADSVLLPRLAVGQEPVTAGEVLRTWTGVSIAEQVKARTPKPAFDRWRHALEARGVLVFQLSLGKGRLRGFSLADEVAPVIAVNTAENLQARTFTLFHELAHLAARTEAACGSLAVAGESGLKTERWCEEVSSATLIPEAELLTIVKRLTANGRQPAQPVDLARAAADRLHVSLRAAAVAMIRAQLLPRSAYAQVEAAAPLADYDKGFARSAGGGQRAPEARVRELGTKPALMVLDAVHRNVLTERDARRYLRLDGAEVSDLAATLMAS